MDLDGDGKRDILSGSYSRMVQKTEDMAGTFQVLWGQADGSFKKAETLNGADGKPLIIPTAGEGENGWVGAICTRPFAVDWDGDGDLDLVVGNFRGDFYLFKGEGKGKFAPRPEPIKTDDGPLKVEGHHGDPFVIDWDGDGDLDLLSGSNTGGVQWVENTAEKGKPPRLKGFQPLIKSAPASAAESFMRQEDYKRPSLSMRVWVDDVNGDGKLDVLVGDNITLASPVDGIAEPEFQRKFQDWTKSVQEIIKESEASSAAKDEKKLEAVNVRLRDLFEKRSKFMKEDRTGSVWLYLQK